MSANVLLAWIKLVEDFFYVFCKSNHKQWKYGIKWKVAFVEVFKPQMGAEA